MTQLSKCFLTGDFREWPLDQATVSELVRVRLVRAKKDTAAHYRELRVRSRVVKGMAHIYMQRHLQDLGKRPRVLKLMQSEYAPSDSTECPLDQIRAHIEARISKEYPDKEFGGAEGAVPQAIWAMIQGDEEVNDVSAFEMKQATMPDTPNAGSQLCQGQRPTIVTDEGDTFGTFSKADVAQATLSDKINIVDVPVANTFENQFVSQYMCRVFPWALNYDCGGADFPELFSDWSWLERSIAQRGGESVVEHLQERWRRLHGEAPLLPGEYAQMLACRPEMHVAGDWMLVPSARNLHWRYAVLHSTFMACKQKVALVSRCTRTWISS